MDNLSQRDKHILLIAARGRLGWQKEACYGRRALVETAMGRYKGIIGSRLRARSISDQLAEAAVGVALLNRMLKRDVRTPFAVETSLRNPIGKRESSTFARSMQQRDWRETSQWMDVVARSGASLFLSPDPAAITAEIKSAMKDAMALSAQGGQGFPIDPTSGTTPTQWKFPYPSQVDKTYDWCGPEGITSFDV